jgi:hypothetical protein
MITREQIKLFLQNIASSHYNIHTFGWGDVPDLLARENVIYPYMMVTPVPSTFEDGYINYGYLVSIADRIREGNQNEVEVDSDTFNIMMQVITQIDNLLYNDVDLVKGQTITPFMEAHRHRVSGHFSELQIRVKYNYDACAIPSDEVPLPLPPPPSCAVANYRVEYENGTLIEAGTIPSGGSKTIEVPDPSVCANATWELRDENGNLLNSGSVASGGSVTIEAPNVNLLIRNSLNQTLYNLSLLSGSSGTQNIGDSSIRLEDSVGALIANSSVVAEGSATIAAPDGTVSVRKSDGVEIYSVDVRSNGTAAQNVADSVIENSDASYTANVKATEPHVLPDSQINVNSVDAGDVVSVKTIDVNITDGVDPVTPTSVGLVGNTLTIEVPSGASPSGVLFKESGLTSQRTQYSIAPNDDGGLTQGTFYTSIVKPSNPKVIAELDLSVSDYWLRLKDPLVVDGVSSVNRFVDCDGIQTFPATANKNLVFIDKLTGYMWYRNQIDFTSRIFEDNIAFADSHSVIIDGVTYDDWIIPTWKMYADILIGPYSANIIDGAITIFTSFNGMATSSTDLITPTNYIRILSGGIAGTGKTAGTRTYMVRKAHNLITAP